MFFKKEKDVSLEPHWLMLTKCAQMALYFKWKYEEASKRHFAEEPNEYGLIKLSTDPEAMRTSDLKTLLNNKPSYGLYFSRLYYIIPDLHLELLSTPSFRDLLALFPRKANVLQIASEEDLSRMPSLTDGHVPPSSYAIWCHNARLYRDNLREFFVNYIAMNQRIPICQSCAAEKLRRDAYKMLIYFPAESLKMDGELTWTSRAEEYLTEALKIQLLTHGGMDWSLPPYSISIEEKWDDEDIDSELLTFHDEEKKRPDRKTIVTNLKKNTSVLTGLDQLMEPCDESEPDSLAFLLTLEEFHQKNETQDQLQPDSTPHENECVSIPSDDAKSSPSLKKRKHFIHSSEDTKKTPMNDEYCCSFYG